MVRHIITRTICLYLFLSRALHVPIDCRLFVARLNFEIFLVEGVAKALVVNDRLHLLAEFFAIPQVDATFICVGVQAKRNAGVGIDVLDFSQTLRVRIEYVGRPKRMLHFLEQCGAKGKEILCTF